MIVIFAVLGLILLRVATPNEAAACGVLCALAVAAINGRLSVRMTFDALRGTVVLSSMILLILAASKVLTQLLAFSGLTRGPIAFQTLLDMAQVAVVVLPMAIPFVLCMSLDQIALLLKPIPFSGPLLDTSGFDPLVFRKLFLLNLALGAITPPFGYALFPLTSSSPKEVGPRDIYAASWPLIGLILLTLVLVRTVPGLANWLSSRLRALGREPVEQGVEPEAEDVVGAHVREIVQREPQAGERRDVAPGGAFLQEGLVRHGLQLPALAVRRGEAVQAGVW